MAAAGPEIASAQKNPTEIAEKHGIGGGSGGPWFRSSSVFSLSFSPGLRWA